MKGGTGLRLRSRAWILSTLNSADSRWARTVAASSPFPISRLLPSRLSRLAGKTGGFWPSRWASTVQYSSGTKALISRSRSQMSRRATDWTRPAERPRRTFSQRIGLTL